jgi:hypothetical protein
MPRVRLDSLGYSPKTHWSSRRWHDDLPISGGTFFGSSTRGDKRGHFETNFMKKLICFAAAGLVALTGVAQPFRPPAVPLVTFDPFLSIWSDADRI